MTIYISVNRHTIAKNRKHGTKEPPLRIAKGRNGKPIYASEVEWSGPARVVYDEENPILKCGARLAIVVEGDVKVVR